MSWAASPSRIHAVTPEGVGDTVFVGLAGTPDEGLFRFENPSGSGFVIADRTTSTIEISGAVTATLKAIPSVDVNGRCAYWDGADRLLYHDGDEWVLVDGLPLGVKPVEDFTVEEQEDGTDKTTYSGDSFYSLDGGFPEIGETAHLSPRGPLRNDGTNEGASCGRTLPGWYSDTGIGRYDARYGAGGEKVFGTEHYAMSGRTDLISPSLRTDSTGHYAYGPIHYDGGAWVIGKKGDEDGWYEGSEPSPENGVSFTWRGGPEGSAEEHPAISVSFTGYSLTGQADDCYCGGVATWL